MFETILGPVFSAVRLFVADRVYRAAQEGGRDGLARFASDFGAQFQLGVPEGTPEAAQEGQDALPMPSAAQTTPAARRARKRS